jgi:Ca-activated chloride channel family protein
MKIFNILRFLYCIVILASCHKYCGYSPSRIVATPPFLHRQADYADNVVLREEVDDLVTVRDIYNENPENPFIGVDTKPISTFSIDADGASYANVRRFIMQENMKPPRGALRTEELLNYFEMGYPYDNPAHPVALNGEVSECPWNPENKLVRIGIKGKIVPDAELPPSNFVFLIDVSGSMEGSDRLKLLKDGFKLFLDELRSYDRVAIVTYAGNAGVALKSTSGNEKDKIRKAINALGSGGSTAGAEGIVTAYQIAQENFMENGNNRVILGTDGDFNVGISSQEQLVKLIEEKRDKGIFLTVLGVGRGNLNDAAMEQIADNGNGTYEYIDKVEQFHTVAKDVKVQIEFNPEVIESYRLIGYENRMLTTEDFRNDSTDAGEIGVGQDITALYEVKPRQNANITTLPAFTVHFRYKLPGQNNSTLLELKIFDEGKTFAESSDYMKFASGIASFSMLMNDSKYKGTSSFDSILGWIDLIHLQDEHGFRKEFREMVEKAKQL